MKNTNKESAIDALDRTSARLLQSAPADGAAPQIEALHYELCRFYRPTLANRGLNRPCELNELMARAA